MALRFKGVKNKTKQIKAKKLVICPRLVMWTHTHTHIHGRKEGRKGKERKVKERKVKEREGKGEGGREGRKGRREGGKEERTTICYHHCFIK